jgi:hypothetical protein
LRFTTTAAIAGAVAISGLIFAPNAGAADGPIGAQAACPNGVVCVYEGTNHTGAMRTYGLSDLNYQGDTFDNGTQVNDRVSSIWNRTGQWVNFYTAAGANINDLCFSEQPGGYRLYLAVEGCDNSLSSHYPAGV